MNLWLVSPDEYVIGNHSNEKERPWTTGPRVGFALVDASGVFALLNGARYAHSVEVADMMVDIVLAKPIFYFAKQIQVKAVHPIDVPLVQSLVAVGADIKAFDQQLLGYACAKGDVDLVKFCLANGCDVHYDDESAYVTACLCKQEEAKAELVKAGGKNDSAGVARTGTGRSQDGQIL